MPKQQSSGKVRTSRKAERQILVVFSDTHGGDKKGLLNPDTMLYQEVPVMSDSGMAVELQPVQVTLNPYQRYLWDIYQKHIEETFALADGDPVAVFHNGDLTQGIKYRDGLNYSDMGSQFFVGASNMRPWFGYQNMRWFRVIWGTDSHIFGEGTAPRLIFDALKRDYPKVDLNMSQHSLATFGGVTFDIAHHGPTGGKRSHLRGNELRYYIKSLMDDEIKRDHKPPDVVVRGHYHVRVEEYVVDWYGKYGRHRTIACISPSYQGMNEHARQMSQSADRVTNGHVAFEIVNGKVLDVHWFCHSVDMRKKEVLE